MAALTPFAFAYWRANCEIHALHRAEDYGFPLTAEQLAKLNTDIEALRPAFERPGQHRYRLRIHRGDGRRLRVVYDTDLQTVVTILSKRNTAHAH